MSSLSYIKTITTIIFIIFFNLKSNAQEGTVSIEQDEKIDRLFKERMRLLKNGELKTYYSIQVISGRELHTARETLKTCKIKFPDLKSDVIYETPNYKVQVGEFRNELDADRALLTISEEYEGAFVLDPRTSKR
jgi:hypothetical protein